MGLESESQVITVCQGIAASLNEGVGIRVITIEQYFSNCGPRTTSGPRVLLIHLINVSTNIHLIFYLIR
jgi:hypothetical protein